VNPVQLDAPNSKVRGGAGNPCPIGIRQTQLCHGMEPLYAQHRPSQVDPYRRRPVFVLDSKLVCSRARVPPYIGQRATPRFRRPSADKFSTRRLRIANQITSLGKRVSQSGPFVKIRILARSLAKQTLRLTHWQITTSPPLLSERLTRRNCGF
jgi:hypothetical protein